MMRKINEQELENNNKTVTINNKTYKSSNKTISSAPAKKGTTVKVSNSPYRYNGVTVNADSVSDLGYGPISSSALVTKIRSGLVSLVLRNGEYYAVKNAPKFNKGFNGFVKK